jgi:hypothetical protein
MLTARGTLGVSLATLPDDGEALLGRAADAGAGGLRVRGLEAASAAWEWARALDLALVVAVPAAAVVEAEEPPQPPNNGGSRGSPHYWGVGGATIELDATSPSDQRALPAALERLGEGAVLLGVREARPGETPAPVPEALPERVRALAVSVHGIPGTADPKRMEEALRGLAAPLRSGGWRQPFWLTDLAAPIGTAGEEQAGWLVRHAAHALALAMPHVFLRLPEADPEPTLLALRMLAAWLEGAERITWLARGQYRAEFVERPNQYLLWAESGITRLPSSFQGPLSARDLAGEVRRVETSRLKLGELPLLVERPEEG